MERRESKRGSSSTHELTPAAPSLAVLPARLPGHRKLRATQQAEIEKRTWKLRRREDEDERSAERAWETAAE